jgi:TfoX/Sxy family transcriptional regulator of competence genes
MMKWQKSPPELEKTFDAAFPADPRAERRKMFGYPAGFVNGSMFGGLWQDSIVLRLTDPDREQITREHGAQPFEPMGRPMKGYITVPAAIIGSQDQLRDWVQRAFECTVSLPPKEKKAPGKKKAPGAKQASPKKTR